MEKNRSSSIIKEHLLKLLEFSKLINSTLDMSEIRERAIQACIELVNCEAGSLLLYDEEKEELYFDVAIGDKAFHIKTIRLRVGQGLAGWVALHKTPLIINDVQNDPRFFKDADKKSGFTTRTMICLPVMSKDKLLGVLQAINKKEGLFDEYDLELLQALGSQIAISIENAKLYDELKDTLYAIILALADTIEKRDPYTGGHTQRVMEYSLMIGYALGLNKEELEKLKLSAVLHDIGKIGIRDAILLKESKLTEEEFKIIQNHTIYGAEILSHIKQLRDVIPGVVYHHEKYDGTGYPYGLKGEEIPLIAQIIAVADTYDAMTTDRPYRKGLSKEVALAELERWAGKQFSPEVVKAFTQIMRAQGEETHGT